MFPAKNNKKRDYVQFKKRTAAFNRFEKVRKVLKRLRKTENYSSLPSSLVVRNLFYFIFSRQLIIVLYLPNGCVSLGITVVFYLRKV